jgi:cytochrome oxidase assembly protein ShyY1
MYAVQWFGIALAVLAFGVVFIWRGVPNARI